MKKEQGGTMIKGKSLAQWINTNSDSFRKKNSKFKLIDTSSNTVSFDLSSPYELRFYTEEPRGVLIVHGDKSLYFKSSQSLYVEVGFRYLINSSSCF